MYNIKIITAGVQDIPEIIKLYKETVINVNSKDYSPEHIQVWASSAENIERWKKAIAEQYFILAYIENKLAGFGSIAPDGYLDFLYVGKDYQRAGVAKTLLAEIERKAAEQNNPQVYSHVSKTARGFFEKFGYQHVHNIQDLYKGVLFINNLMVKNFTGQNLNGSIITKRCLLRKYTEDDREISVRLSLDKDVMHFMGGEHPTSIEEASAVFNKCFEVYMGWLNDKPLGNRHFEIWGIKFEGKLIGHLELKQSPNTINDELEVVYMLDKEYWGRGIIAEILIEVIEHVCSIGKHVIATIDPENIQTVRSLEKAGIEKQGWWGEGEDRVYKVWLKQEKNILS